MANLKYDEVEAKQVVEDRIMQTHRAWAEKHDLFNEIYSIYRFWTGTTDEVTLGQKANIFIPLAFSIIETKVPRAVQSLLSFDPYMKVEGRNRKDNSNAEFVSQLMKYQLEDEINAFFPLVMWMKEAFMYGNSYMMVGWTKEQARVRKLFPQFFADEIIGYDFKFQNETVYDGITYNHLDIFDCFPAPFGLRINGREHERMPYFILRSEPTKQFLQSMGQKGILDKAKTKEVIELFPHGVGDLDKTRRERMTYNRLSPVEVDDRFAPRYVMYTMFEHDWWVSYINGHIVRNSENPYGDNKIPIVQAMDTPVPHEHFAIGQIEPIIKLNYYANDMENLTLDFLAKDINPGGFLNSNIMSPADQQRFAMNPDGLHFVKGDPRLAYAPVRRESSGAILADREKINIERLIDKTLGQSDVSRGVSRSSQDTATEIVALIDQANFRFDLSIRLIKNESMIPLFDMMLHRNQQFFPRKGVKEITAYTEKGDVQFRNIALGQILGNYRFRMKINPVQGNKFAYAQTLIRFLDVLNASEGKNPLIALEIAKFLQIDNAEELMTNPVEQAVATIVQASQEGLLANGRQASVVLGQVLNILAPKGSRVAKAIGGAFPQAKDERDVAKKGANSGV